MTTPAMTNPNEHPLLIASAPNGARKTREEHHQLPVTTAQLADTAAAVLAAGAQMIHLHVRDARGKHTLDAGAYQAAIEAIRAKAGNDLFIQITSEAAGVYDSGQQRRAMYAATTAAAGVLADGVSLALRELIRAPEDVAPAGELFHHLARRGVLAQYILFSIDDINRYGSLLKQGVIPPLDHSAGHSILLVVGRYGAQPSTPETLHRMLEALRGRIDQPPSWMVCAFGEHEFDCLLAAVKLGGHARVGFENSLLLRTGQVAADNRQLVTQLVEAGNPDGRPPADIHQARKILGSAALN